MHTHFSLRCVIVTLGLLALAACERPPESAFSSRGPEALLDISSEVVNLSMAQPGDRDELSRWIDKDQPTRAELYCMTGDLSCTATQKLLDRRGVPTMMVPSGNNTVTLVYERILAHDCSSRVTDPEDFYNVNYPSFGCATAANTVQQVSNKQDFVNPRLSDNPSSVSAVGAYRRAYAPPARQNAGYSVSNSLTGSN